MKTLICAIAATFVLAATPAMATTPATGGSASGGKVDDMKVHCSKKENASKAECKK